MGKRKKRFDIKIRNGKAVTIIELTSGPWDHAIGYGFFPWLRRLVPFFGNFFLARALLYATVVVNVITAVFFEHSLSIGIFSALLGFVIVFVVGYIDIGQVEKAVKGLGEDEFLNMDLFLKVRSLGKTRVILPFLWMVLFTATKNYGTDGILVALLWESALYAATCICPRRKSKTMAKIKAKMKQTKVALPRWIPIPSQG